MGQLTSTYTNAKFLVIAGDDRVVPHRRVPDGTLTYPENNYAGPWTAPPPSARPSAPTTTSPTPPTATSPTRRPRPARLWLALPDLAVGRLVETPDQMTATINAFIAQNGQVDLDTVLVTGYDFLEDSATAMQAAWAAGGETCDPPPRRRRPALPRLDRRRPRGRPLLGTPHALHNLNDHSDHYTFGTPSGLLTAAQMDAHAGTPLSGSLFFNVGCHSGLNVPPSFTNALDLPELMLRKGAVAYVGNTGFGWGLRYGVGYSERLMQLITNRLLAQPSCALGTALSDAKRDYFLENHRYDVFDEKSLMESTLYGLPMYEVVVDPAARRAPEPPLSASGPDRQVSRRRRRHQVPHPARRTPRPPHRRHRARAQLRLLRPRRLRQALHPRRRLLHPQRQVRRRDRRRRTAPLHLRLPTLRNPLPRRPLHRRRLLHRVPLQPRRRRTRLQQPPPR